MQKAQPKQPRPVLKVKALPATQAEGAECLSAPKQLPLVIVTIHGAKKINFLSPFLFL